MERFLLLVLVGVMVSCSTVKKSSPLLAEEELLKKRKYIGDFVDYCHTGPETIGGVNLIWIRTTIYNSFGKISAHGKHCEFSPGDKIYLKRLYDSPGANGNWEYQIENDSSVFYRVSYYRYEKNSFILASF